MTARVEYDVESLRDQIAKSRDAKIKAAQEKYAHAIDLPARRAAWRAEQEKRVRALARNLKSISDDDLADFRIRSGPSGPGRYAPTDEETRDKEIEKAEQSCERALTRLAAMRKSGDGTIFLTRNMLREWFGL